MRVVESLNKIRKKGVILVLQIWNKEALQKSVIDYNRTY